MPDFFGSLLWVNKVVACREGQTIILHGIAVDSHHSKTNKSPCRGDAGICLALYFFKFNVCCRHTKANILHHLSCSENIVYMAPYKNSPWSCFHQASKIWIPNPHFILAKDLSRCIEIEIYRLKVFHVLLSTISLMERSQWSWFSSYCHLYSQFVRLALLWWFLMVGLCPGFVKKL